jgi:hypothetical protein
MSDWARLVVRVGEGEATHFLGNQWGEKIPKEVTEAGLVRKARFEHLS